MGALREVVGARNCSARHYDVADGLFGTAAAYNTSESSALEYLADSRGKPLAWLSGPSALSELLNNEDVGCCAGNVTTMEQCLCRVFEAVGIIDKALNVSYMDPVPTFQYVYAAVRANVTNQTSSPGTLGALVPTWENLLDVMGETFQYTLNTPEHSVPRCSPTEEVRRTLDGSSYSVLFKENQQAFQQWGATAENCKIEDPALFRAHAADLCTNAVVTRVYLCSFLDASPLFEGTGWTSGGTREYITVPNPSVASVLPSPMDADILSFELPQDQEFHCPV